MRHRVRPQGCYFGLSFITSLPLPQHGGQHLVQAVLIVGVKRAELPGDQAGLDGGAQGLDDRWLEQAGRLPMYDGRFAHRGHRADLASDGHQDQVGPLAVMGTGRTWLVMAIRIRSGRSR